ncbi:unnamed protein product [Schistosoma margrebowiei]|uniref:Uncharacterized protein n=1 Tax=Schistosoma margrebowiei TaxID=48269 RepID=A0A183MCQ6_9TREM|nr:unnamed protein product [Schistosoma margrebowiei]
MHDRAPSARFLHGGTGTSCQLTWTTTVRKPVDKQERATDTKTGMSIGIPSMEHPSTLMMTCRGSAPSLRRRY